MDQLDTPSPVPTSQMAGATSDLSQAQTAPGTAPGPDDVDVPQQDYRRIEREGRT